MTLIVVLFSMAFLLLGYYLMDKIDKFIGYKVNPLNEDFTDKYTKIQDYKRDAILIYGDNELTELVKAYCNSQNYIYEIITEINCLNTEYKHTYLFSLSYNDADNLMISSVGFKIYSIPHVITLCNSQNNLKIYKEFNFDKVLLYNHDTEKIFNIIKELVEDAVKNKTKV